MPGFELFGDAERHEVQQVLDHGVLMRYGFDAARNGQWKAREMEQQLAKRMGVGFAHLTSSGTAALTVALASAGIGAGDEVIVPCFTFVASFEAIMALGAIPVLANIDDTLCLSATTAAAAVTARTKAIMPVHMCGAMADLKPLKQLCEKHNLILIEDACQAIGGTYEGQPLGSYGHIGCFSFDYVKTITCGEGGAMITNTREYYEKAHAYADHGHDHIGNDRGAEQHPYLGYNFRISELNAAVGLAQLQRLDEFLLIQKRNYHILKEALTGISGVTFRTIPPSGVPNYSFLNIFLPDGNSAALARKQLSDGGVDGCFYWFDNNWHYHRKWDHLKGLHTLGPVSEAIRQGIDAQRATDFRISDQWMSRTLSFLIKIGWTEEETASRAVKASEILRRIVA